MRPRARTTDAYVLAVVLVAAVAGRLVDAAGLLPGVHEATVVRDAGIGWLAALVTAAGVAAAAVRRWSRTTSLTSAAAVVLPGQLIVFFTAEAAVRTASGRGPLDPDGAVGALLQAALAALLLLALTAAAGVALGLGPLDVLVRSWPGGQRSALHHDAAGRRLPAPVGARGPPVVADP